MMPIDSDEKIKHVLVFEPLGGGHRSEFIAHLLEYIGNTNVDSKRYTFVVESAQLEYRAMNNVSIREISASERADLRHSRGPLGGFVFWRILKSYLKELRPNHLIVMELTWLELPLCFHRPPCSLSGILFVQYPELRLLLHRQWMLRVKFWWKELKTAWFLRTSKPSKIFLLNGAHSCKYLNHRFSTSCYAPIPDPVTDVTAETGVDVGREYGIGADRGLFLFFGSMSDRKGVGPLVEAIKFLSEKSARQTAFLFCGVPEADFRKRYHMILDDLIRARPDICIHIDEQFVSLTRIRTLFEQVDWILMPYARPEYSSGILAHAAAATPVIAPREGLVGRQIREYGLGLDIPIEAFSLTIEIAASKKHVFEEVARQAFLAASRPYIFAKTLLDG